MADEIGEAAPPVTAARLSSLMLANMCCGLIGVQIVWGLQNVNTSRIFQTLGANLAELPILWIAGPITGLLVQPIVGHLSDRTWTRLGRRRPYLVIGALLSAVALIAMPRAQSLWAASLMLWLLTGAINVATEPFRALVADNVPERQRNKAYALQVAFIGAGAVFASALPWMLSHWFGVAADARPGHLPPSVKVAFDVGAAGLLLSIAVTVLTTSERPPGMLEVSATTPKRREWDSNHTRLLIRRGAIWALLGVVLSIVTFVGGLRRELYLIGGLVTLFGLGQLATARNARDGVHSVGLLEIIDDVILMPDVLRRLAVVQFFTWFGLFALWIYAVPALTENTVAAGGESNAGYNAVADWVGILFAFYNAVAVLGAFILPLVIARAGRREAHAACLLLGAFGLVGLGLMRDDGWLLVPMVGIGFAWASILSIPYAMVASAVPPTRMGVYMGIHNVFLVLPQLVASAILGWAVSIVFGNHAHYALLLAAGSFSAAGLLTLGIPDQAGDPHQA
jgi:maltose/moltooligosaccharide transporter